MIFYNDNQINSQAQSFKKELFKIINNNQLPSCTTYYILKDTCQEVRNIYFEHINKQQNQKNKEKQQQGEED